MLYEWRAELAMALDDEADCGRLLSKAREGYEAMGAPAHAERLAT